MPSCNGKNDYSATTGVCQRCLTSLTGRVLEAARNQDIALLDDTVDAVR